MAITPPCSLYPPMRGRRRTISARSLLTFTVCFDIDANGILNVSAEDKMMGRRTRSAAPTTRGSWARRLRRWCRRRLKIRQCYNSVLWMFHRSCNYVSLVFIWCFDSYFDRTSVIILQPSFQGVFLFYFSIVYFSIVKSSDWICWFCLLFISPFLHGCSWSNRFSKRCELILFR